MLTDFASTKMRSQRVCAPANYLFDVDLISLDLARKKNFIPLCGKGIIFVQEDQQGERLEKMLRMMKHLEELRHQQASPRNCCLRCVHHDTKSQTFSNTESNTIISCKQKWNTKSLAEAKLVVVATCIVDCQVNLSGRAHNSKTTTIFQDNKQKNKCKEESSSKNIYQCQCFFI